MLRLLCLLFLFACLLPACQRAGQSGSNASLVIQTPSRHQLAKAGIQSLAALPSNRKICYGVSIQGPGIEGYAGSSCAPATGVVGGFVDEGQPLELFVPRGENRTIELYLFAMPVGSTSSCPAMGQNLQGEGLKSTYLIGSKTGVALLNDVETVEITVSFPGLANSMASQLSVPATCSPGVVPNKSGFHISAASGSLTGTGLKLLGRVGRVQSGTTATGSGYKLLGKTQ